MKTRPKIGYKLLPIYCYEIPINRFEWINGQTLKLFVNYLYNKKSNRKVKLGTNYTWIQFSEKKGLNSKHSSFKWPCPYTLTIRNLKVKRWKKLVQFNIWKKNVLVKHRSNIAQLKQK